MEATQTANAEKIVLPLCCFPNLHWLKLAGQKGVFVDIHQDYVKQSLRNRFEILSVNGKLSITIPVVGQKGEKTPLHSIKLASGKWRSATWMAIKSAYGKAAYFEHYAEPLEAIIRGKQELLNEFNMQALTFLLEILGNEFAPQFTDSKLNREEIRLLSECLEPSFIWPPTPSYLQVFSDRFPFQPNLSALDLVMNQGPGAKAIIQIMENDPRWF